MPGLASGRCLSVITFIKGSDGFSELQIELVQRRKKGDISHEDAQYQVEKFWMGALRRALIEGDLECGSLMAGQSVGLVQTIRPLKEALAYLIRNAEAELKRIEERLYSISQS